MLVRKSLLPLLIFLVALFSHNTAKAASLHAILLCDTDADGIEGSVRADFRNISKEVNTISKDTKLKLRLKKFVGKKVDSSFLDTLDSLKIGPDDVVIFYWSGHGLRFDTQQDPWPVFDFEYDSQRVSQYTVTEKLMNKNPRLLLSIADCCNELLEKSLFWKGKADKKIRKENYRTLFLNFSGTYIATAASPGEISFGLNGNSHAMDLPAGGFFTNALLESLHEETSFPNPNISWELIFGLAVDKTIEYQLRDPYEPVVYHTPQYGFIPK